MPALRHALLPLCLCLSLAGTATAAGTRAAQKTQAEAQRAELQQKLKTLKNDIDKTESAKDQASDALEESEQAISVANRSLRELQSEQGELEDKLRALQEQQQALGKQVEKQKSRLADFLRRQYMRGDSDRIKLLLSGDNPNRINRDLHYLGYVSQTQAKMIDALRASLQAVEKNAADTLEAKEELDEIAAEKQQHKAELEKEKKRRAGLLNQLSSKLHAQKKQADSLQKDEQRLASLVIRLNKLIEEQAHAAQVEKQRQEQLAAQEKSRPASAAQHKPASAPPKAAPAPLADANDGSDFARLKGQLHLPLKGELLARFGSKRGDGPSWKGVLIKAAEGTDVKAVAAGTVVFAEWLRGFGNMIILDHGGGYWSLYGGNQAVFKHVGDSVRGGDTIAAAGNTGGNEESGLYFEMRHQGRVFDPLSWVTIR